MSYRPDEKDWMAYLYGELEGDDKLKMDQYFAQHPEARAELEKFGQVRSIMSSVQDKEVIAPPIFVEGNKQRFFWNSPYFNTIVSIAASLLFILLVGKLTDTRISFANNEFRLSFGEVKDQPVPVMVSEPSQMLTASEVQEMINSSLEQNNAVAQASMKESQARLESSIRKNLADNSGKIDQLVRQASTASQEQIQQYVTSIQNQNMQMVKDYFQLTSGEQKKYIEDILVDFSQYLQQQRSNDLQVVQTELNSIRQNTDVFKQETEQILSSIISSVGNTPSSTEIKN